MRPPMQHTLRLPLPLLEATARALVRQRRYHSKSLQSAVAKVGEAGNQADRRDLNIIERHHGALQVTKAALAEVDATIERARVEEARRAELTTPDRRSA